MIIDACLFSNELDVLEIRLHELDPLVDKFVIVESLEAHGSANRKATPFLEAHWGAVRRFEHKVRYVVLPQLLPPFEGKDQCWPRENFHRNAIMPAVREVMSGPGDILMISDCDEIPRAAMVKARLGWLGAGLWALNQDFFYYNVSNNVGRWNGTVVGTVGAVLAAGGPQACRDRRDDLPRIDDAGWHLSYFGGVDRIREKVSNFAHACDLVCRQALERDPQELVADVLSGTDLYHRPGEGRREHRASDDARLPRYFLDHRDRFKHLTEEFMREAR